jgi:glutaminyl-peptide cyclotransferase
MRLPLWRVSSALVAAALCLRPVSAYAPLSDDSLRILPLPGAEDFDIYTGALLSPILIPRVPGTAGSAAVLNHFVNFFHTSLPDWNITFQNSTSETPLQGNKEFPFVNLIATRDPPWSNPGDVGRLSLVAHYDSKISPEGFIGATDSAAPCAMILHAVRAIDAALTKKWTSMQAEGVDTFDGIEELKGLEVLFLDGEEAFVSWTDRDSLYGARSLAEEWEHEFHAAFSTHKTRLESIELFLLLDLLGAQDPSIPSYFKTTHWAYQHMARLELRLRQLGLFKSGKDTTWFPDKDKSSDATAHFPSHMMQDDHIPFMARGVEVLHLIPLRYPVVWHRIEDDGEHLHIPTVEDWATLTAAFAAEWLELDGFFDQAGRNEARNERRNNEHVMSKTEL